MPTSKRTNAATSRLRPRYGKIDYEMLGRRLKEERKRLQYTQEELAELIDVTPAFIGHIERADRSLSLETLVKLCNELDVTIDYLLTDTLYTKDDDVIAEIQVMLKDKTRREKAAILDIMRAVARNV